MGGTKIFVLQMKDLIRTTVFAVLGLALIVLLVILFIPRQKPQNTDPSSLYIPGTYSSAIILHDQPVDVLVTVTDNEITAVEMSEMESAQRTFYPLFEPALSDLAAEILHYQTADIVPETDSPVTTSILRKAVSDALAQASVR